MLSALPNANTSIVAQSWDSDCCRVALVRRWIPPSMPAAAVESGPSTVGAVFCRSRNAIVPKDSSVCDK